MATKKQKLTPQQMLDRTHVWLMRQPEFVAYSGVIMVGDTRIESDPKKCPTAYTDGFNVVYGEQFMGTLAEEEIRFVVLHENLHKMFRHTVTWFHLFRRSPVLANIAADYVVNGIIQEAGSSGVKMPDGACYDADLSHNKDVGEVFRLLEKKYPQLASCPMCNAQSGGGGQQDDGNGSGEDQQPGQQPCKGHGLPQGFDEHGWNEAQACSPEELRDIQEQIDSAIRQGAILAGQVAGNVPREFEGLTKVKIDPWAILRQFLTDTCQGDGELSYRRPNRRSLQHDLIMPTEVCETLPHILFALDTSGSIHGEVLNYLVSNVAHVFKCVNPEQVTLLYWDTQVAGVEKYEQGELDKMLSTTAPKGGGGTSPECVSRWIKKEGIQPTVIVYLTDGYVDAWPTDAGSPTVFLVYENGSACPPYGTVAHI
jgi:predicted metal-dependent peptidase